MTERSARSKLIDVLLAPVAILYAVWLVVHSRRVAVAWSAFGAVYMVWWIHATTEVYIAVVLTSLVSVAAYAVTEV